MMLLWIFSWVKSLESFGLPFLHFNFFRIVRKWILKRGEIHWIEGRDSGKESLPYLTS